MGDENRRTTKANLWEWRSRRLLRDVCVRTHTSQASNVLRRP